jgi:alpha-N-arabinofuranosidase
MQKARVVLDRDFVLGELDRRVFGGFAEHLGRHIYTGLYEPGHPTADADGFRGDVLELVRGLGMPVVRYPGGNFVSAYDWTDGIGPREKRPRRLDLAWGATESNAFGLNEFVLWCRKAGVEPMIAVNLGTAGPREAAAIVEYCNHPGGTHWSDLRRSHGFPEPHGIRHWCLGNEMDGPWQMGHKTAFEYGRVACEAAKLMRGVSDGAADVGHNKLTPPDKRLQLVACGSSGRGMPTFGAWELEVLEHCYDQVDHVSLHTYYGNNGEPKDFASFLAQPENMADFIRETASLCDAVAAKRKAKRKMMLAFDEWNVWSADSARHAKPAPWAEAGRLIEHVYNVADALTVGGMLITLLNHADRVKIACLAQVVNAIAPVMTEPGGAAWRQAIYHPFAQASAFARGLALRPAATSPVYDAKDREAAPYLAVAATFDPEARALALFMVNRHLTEPMEVCVDARGFPFAPRAWEGTTLHDDDLLAVNTAAAPDRVQPRPATPVAWDNGVSTLVLPPASWSVYHAQ